MPHLTGILHDSGRELATQLLRADSNQRIEILELCGSTAPDLRGVFEELHAQSRRTKCLKYLYSLSIISDTAQGGISRTQYFDLIARIEEKLGLLSQPRAVVLHATTTAVGTGTLSGPASKRAKTGLSISPTTGKSYTRSPRNSLATMALRCHLVCNKTVARSRRRESSDAPNDYSIAIPRPQDAAGYMLLCADLSSTGFAVKKSVL